MKAYDMAPVASPSSCVSALCPGVCQHARSYPCAGRLPLDNGAKASESSRSSPRERSLSPVLRLTV